MKLSYSMKRLLVGVLAISGLTPLGFSNSNTGPVSASDQQVQAIDLVGKQEQKKVDLFTGSFGYSIPIACAPARNGSEPNLALAYSSAGDNGWCGMGWDLNIGYIERNTRDGFPVSYSTGMSPLPLSRYDDTKGFILNLSGTESKIFAVATNSGIIEYRPETDTEFLRCFLDTANNNWTVYDKSGNAYYFGETTNARVANPKSGWSGYSGTFRWALDQIVTPTGDWTTVAYATYNSPNNGLPERTLYPTQLSYNGHTNNNYSATVGGPNTIIFQTELRTNDWRFSYRWGFRTEQCRRLTNILCQTASGAQNIWSYRLKYGVSPATGRSLLTNVVVYGYDANNNAVAFLTNSFAYQGNPNGVSFGSPILWTNLNLNTPGSSSGSYEPDVAQINLIAGLNYTVADLVDMDGDGLPDRVCYDTNSPNQYQVQKNLGMQVNGSGSFALSRYAFGPTSTGTNSASDSNLMPDGENYGALNTPYGRIRDLNGDGLPDRVMDYWKPFVTSGVPYTNFAVMLNSGNGFSGASLWAVTNWDSTNSSDGVYATYQCVEGGGNIVFSTVSNSVGVGLFDLNGDNLPDRVMTTYELYEAMTNLYVQANTSSGFTQLRRFPYKSQNYNGSLSGQSASAVSQWAGIETAYSHFIDLNGDGLPDHVMPPMNSSNPAITASHPFSYYAVEYNDGYSFESTNTSTAVPGAFDRWAVVSPLTNSSIIYNGTTFNGDDIGALPFCGMFDMNGDGLPDRVMLDPTTWSNTNAAWLVYLNNGHGFNPTPIRVTGINTQGHAGTTDSPWWGVQGIGIQGSESGNEITTLIDIDGDGLLDRVMAVYYPSTQSPTAQYFLVQLNDGPFPDLLVSVNNGIGGNITVAYNSSTAYDNRVNTGDPNSVSYMPYPRQVTAAVSVSDGINSAQTTTYGYGGGYFDGNRREFHGFAVVTNTDPTLRYTVTYFHTGGGRNYQSLGEYSDAGNFAKAGMAYRTESYGNDNALYHVEVNQVDQTSLGFGRYFPYTSLSADYDYPGPKITLTDYAYNLTTGNLTNKVEYGQVTNLSLTTFGFTDITSADNRCYHTIYATISSNSYILDHPGTANLTDGNNNIVQETKYTYNTNSGTMATKMMRIASGYYATNSYGSYTTYGMVGQKTDPVGVQTVITYDSTYNTYPATTRLRAIPGSSDDNKDFITTTSFDPRSGDLIASTDLSGVTISNSFDSFCRPTETDKIPAGSTSPVWMKKYAYPAVLKPILSGVATNYVDMVENDGLSGFTNRTYIDGLGRAIQTRIQGENSNYRVISTAYDGRGNAFLATWPVFGSGIGFTKPAASQTATWTGYDAYGRVSTSRAVSITVNGNGAVTGESNLAGETDSPLAAKTWTYVNGTDPWWIIFTDEDGNVRRYGLDAFGRTNQIQEVNGTSTYTNFLKYDLADNLTNIVNANGENIFWAYNNAGEAVAMADPYLGQWTYLRDYAGRLRVQTDGRGDVISNSYINPSTTYQDALGRLQVQTVYSFNPSNKTLVSPYTNTFVYDSSDDGNYTVYKGLLYKTIDSQGLEKTGYDNRARTVKTTRHLNINNRDYTTAFTYNDGNKVTSTVYPNSGPTVTNLYFTGGAIQQVTRYGGTEQYYTVSANAYDEFGHVTNFVYGNTLATTRNYYPVSKRLKKITAGTVFTRTFTYSSGDDILSLDGTGVTNVSVAYDDLHRIKTYIGTTGLSGSYGYDSVGNLTNNAEGGGSVYGYGVRRPQAVKSAFGLTNLYDLCGNMIVRHGGVTNSQSLAYDAENRLVRFAQAGTNLMLVQFGYDAQGARLWKWNNHNPTNLQVWIGDYYEEKNGKTLFHIFANGQQVCTFETNSVLFGGSDTNRVAYYYHEDNINSSCVLSSGNSPVTQQEADAYYPFGRNAVASPQAVFKVSRQFTGQIKDDETGLYYYGARYYDAELGRFIQADTIIQDLSNPQSYNRYSYCVNDPLRYTDPDGHELKTTFLQDLGTIVGSWFATPPQHANNTQISLQTAALGPTENIIPAMAAKTVEMSGEAAEAAAEQYVGGKVLEAGAAAIGKAGEAILSDAAKAGENVAQGATSAEQTGMVANQSGRAGRQARLKDLANDPNTSSADRGWIQNEQRQVNNGNRDTIRNPPGKDLAHQRGREAAKGYNYEYSDLQNKDLHKTQHKFDDFGRANKERPVKPNE